MAAPEAPARSSRRPLAWGAAAAVLVAGGVVAAALLTSGGSARSPVAVVVPFRLPAVMAGGPDAVLRDHPGRPVVLTFFAAWCEPCKKELPAVEALAARPGGPAVVGVDVLDQRADAQDLLAASRVTFPAGYDHDGAVGARWGVNGLPVTVFVGSDGRIVHYHRGQLGASELDRLAASTR